MARMLSGYSSKVGELILFVNKAYTQLMDSFLWPRMALQQVHVQIRLNSCKQIKILTPAICPLNLQKVFFKPESQKCDHSHYRIKSDAPCCSLFFRSFIQSLVNIYTLHTIQLVQLCSVFKMQNYSAQQTDLNNFIRDISVDHPCNHFQKLIQMFFGVFFLNPTSQVKLISFVSSVIEKHSHSLCVN